MNGILYMNVKILENEMLFQKFLSMISSDRKEKIMKFKNPVPARLSLGAGILIKIMLEQQNCGHLLNKICYEEHGKPYFEDANFHFNLSHSGEYVICAYGNEPLGIDIQKTKSSIPKNTKKILTAEETEYLFTLDETNRIISFYKIWSRKESLVKSDGRGLRIPLSDLSMIKHNDFQNTFLFEDKEVYFHDLSILLPDYTVCICSKTEFIPDQIFEVTENFLIKY